MKILYLYQYFTARQGHFTTRCYEQARRLIAMGHDVTVVTSPGYLPEEYQRFTKVTHIDIEGVPVIIIPVAYSNYMSFSRRIVAFFQFAIRASLVAMNTKADIVFATSPPLTIMIPGIMTKLWQRIPLVFEARDLWPEIPIANGAIKNPVFIWMAQAMEYVAYHASSKVVTLSPGMVEGVMKRGIPREKIELIYNASDTDLFDVPKSTGDPIRARLNLTPDQPLVVYTGSFGLMNRVGYLVDIAHEMKSIMPECHFLLVGAGKEFEITVEKAKLLGVLDQNVSIWEPVVKTEIPAILAAATIATSTVFPIKAMWNNSANKVFDAMAAGLPIAINHGGWQVDLFAETGIGIRMADDNPKQAAGELAAFLRDKEKLAHAAKTSKELAYTRFHRDTMVQRLEAVLRAAAGKQPSE